MRARDVMSSPVITLRMDTPVSAAAALLVSHGFTSAPVVDAENRVVGIATESDLVRGRIRPEGWPPDERAEPLVGAVMTPSPVGMRPEDDLADVVELMLGKRLRSVPIVEDGELVGIVTRRDVLRAVARRELTSEDVWRRRAGEPDAARGEVIGS
ncbi:HPP family protein [Pseudonocardia zijingensis]